MIIPRGCAFIAMHRRQDAYKAIDALKNHKLGGRAITISWAPGKGVKSKEWKEYWDLETGVSYIPWSKLDDSTDFEALEEGGMIDEESAPNWLTEKLKAETQKKEQRKNAIDIPQMPNMGLFGLPGAGLADTSQPPPTAMPPMMATAPPMVPPFAHQMPPRFMGPMGMPIPQNLSMPLGVPPPMNGQLMMPGGMVPGMPMKNMPSGPNSGPFKNQILCQIIIEILFSC
jgi:RNA-binding protein 16